MSLSKQELFALLPAKMLRQRADCGIFKQVNNGDISLQEFLQPAMNLNNMYRSAAQVKEIVIDTYILHLKYFLPNRGNELFYLSLGHHLRRSMAMLNAIGGGEILVYLTD